MDALKQLLDGVLGKFVRDDGGIYKGQCPQLPKDLVIKCGGKWTGQTYNGNKLVDRVVELGGYRGEGKNGMYRIASCDVAGSAYGHTWVEIRNNGVWTIYEQNVSRDGVKAANFGAGTVYPVTKTASAGTWRKNIRYAGHPAIDDYIAKHTTKKTNEQIADEVIAGKWGNGQERKDRLAAAGYNYSEVQAIVNQKVKGPNPTVVPTTVIEEGCKVTLTKWVDYKGTALKKTRDYYYVSQKNGDRAVLRADSMSGPVYAAVNTANLKRI